MSAAILVLQLQGENFFQVEKFEISHCAMIFSAQIPIFHIVQQKESFLKSVQYLW